MRATRMRRMTHMERTARVARVWRTVHDDRGTALVEFALVLPILLVLLFGVIDFGRAFLLRSTLAAGVREGARAGAVHEAPCTGAGLALMRTRVREAVTAAGQRPPDDAAIRVTTPGGCGVGATAVVVAIDRYPFEPVTPVLALIGARDALTVSVAATYRWERSPAP